MSGSPRKPVDRRRATCPTTTAARARTRAQAARSTSGSGGCWPRWSERPIRSGRDSFAWRTIDAALAALTYDSSSEPAAAAVVRGPDAPRQLTFEAPELTVGVEVTVLGSHRRLIGQLVPAQRAMVTVRHQQGGMVAVEADELGRFRAEDVPSGLSSLRCQLGGIEEGTAVVTDWIVL